MPSFGFVTKALLAHRSADFSRSPLPNQESRLRRTYHTRTIAFTLLQTRNRLSRHTFAEM